MARARDFAEGTRGVCRVRPAEGDAFLCFYAVWPAGQRGPGCASVRGGPLCLSGSRCYLEVEPPDEPPPDDGTYCIGSYWEGGFRGSRVRCVRSCLSASRGGMCFAIQDVTARLRRAAVGARLRAAFVCFARRRAALK
jgi:hypothetical protein